MSSRLLVSLLAVSLLSLGCLAKSDKDAPAPVALSEAALAGESLTPVTCGQALRIAEHHGYRKVRVQSCFGSEYSFRATKGGGRAIVLVDPANGRLWEGKTLR